ncbi:hypothetical protein ACVWXO_001389 [Bradyrhizobium sp. LM2.7]
MTIQGRLKEMLKTVAVALGDQLLARLVFVGGCTTALYITDPVTLEGVRATDDIDLIVDLAGFPEWAKLLEQLRKQGFSEPIDDNVICRMKLGELKVDFMPDDEEILGFSNRWYAKGIETAVETSLDENITIRHLTRWRCDPHAPPSSREERFPDDPRDNRRPRPCGALRRAASGCSGLWRAPANERDRRAARLH